jgi:hypothetical protein
MPMTQKQTEELNAFFASEIRERKENKVVTIQETRRRLLRDLDTLIADGEKQQSRALKQQHYDRVYSSQCYVEGLKVAKKAVIIVMDNLGN